ncbi:RNase adapter RapZ [Alphaproteobacteria bacterium LSUCC0684]
MKSDMEWEAEVPPDMRRLVLISGLAGSGYSTALTVLEDVGFLAVDNLPLALMDHLISVEVETAGKKVAVSIDGRTSGFDVAGLAGLLEDLRRRLGPKVSLVYLTAEDNELYRRYNATRRPHPLAPRYPGFSLSDAIRQDRKDMESLEKLADVFIDTTRSSPSDFRKTLLDKLGIISHDVLSVTVQSFSYRRGVPQDADMVLDMRFLKNPHWEEGMAELTGEDSAVQAFIEKDPAFRPFIDAAVAMLEETLPRYHQEGRPRFVLATGCTGGRHRSVFAALTLSEALKNRGYSIRLNHLEI